MKDLFSHKWREQFTGDFTKTNSDSIVFAKPPHDYGISVVYKLAFRSVVECDWVFAAPS